MQEHECPIINLRLRRGLSRYKLAQYIGMSYENLSLIERGLRKSLSDGVAPKLASFFDVNEQQLKKDYVQWRQSLAVV